MSSNWTPPGSSGQGPPAGENTEPSLLRGAEPGNQNVDAGFGSNLDDMRESIAVVGRLSAAFSSFSSKISGEGKRKLGEYTQTLKTLNDSLDNFRDALKDISKESESLDIPGTGRGGTRSYTQMQLFDPPGVEETVTDAGGGAEGPPPSRGIGHPGDQGEPEMGAGRQALLGAGVGALAGSPFAMAAWFERQKTPTHMTNMQALRLGRAGGPSPQETIAGMTQQFESENYRSQEEFFGVQESLEQRGVALGGEEFDRITEESGAMRNFIPNYSPEQIAGAGAELTHGMAGRDLRLRGITDWGDSTDEAFRKILLHVSNTGEMPTREVLEIASPGTAFYESVLRNTGGDRELTRMILDWGRSEADSIEQTGGEIELTDEHREAMGMEDTLEFTERAREATSSSRVAKRYETLEETIERQNERAERLNEAMQSLEETFPGVSKALIGLSERANALTGSMGGITGTVSNLAQLWLMGRVMSGRSVIPGRGSMSRATGPISSGSGGFRGQIGRVLGGAGQAASGASSPIGGSSAGPAGAGGGMVRGLAGTAGRALGGVGAGIAAFSQLRSDFDENLSDERRAWGDEASGFTRFRRRHMSDWMSEHLFDDPAPSNVEGNISEDRQSWVNEATGFRRFRRRWLHDSVNRHLFRDDRRDWNPEDDDEGPERGGPRPADMALFTPPGESKSHSSPEAGVDETEAQAAEEYGSLDSEESGGSGYSVGRSTALPARLRSQSTIEGMRAIGSTVPGARLTSAYRSGSSTYHGKGQGTDWGGPTRTTAGYRDSGLRAIFHRFASVGTKLNELFLSGAPFWIYNGQKRDPKTFGSYSRLFRTHKDHVHVATTQKDLGAGSGVDGGYEDEAATPASATSSTGAASSGPGSQFSQEEVDILAGIFGSTGSASDSQGPADAEDAGIGTSGDASAPNVGSGEKLSDSELMQVIRAAGFSGNSAVTAFAVAKAESGGDAGAHNPNASTGDNSYGLFQINMLGNMGPARRKQYGLSSNEDLFDPMINAKIAYDMSRQGSSWGHWSVHPSSRSRGAKGSGYERHLNTGRALLSETGGLEIGSEEGFSISVPKAEGTSEMGGLEMGGGMVADSPSMERPIVSSSSMGSFAAAPMPTQSTDRQVNVNMKISIERASQEEAERLAEMVRDLVRKEEGIHMVGSR